MHKLEVSSPTTEVRREVDAFGNLVCSLAVDSVARAIDFAVWVVVERDARGGPIVISPDDFASPIYREATPLTRSDAAIDEIAGDLRAGGDAPAALAARINEWVCHRLTYIPGVTDVGTTAAEALALGRGVCQDYAHLMLALCRACGVPARYVSGHLLGEGGTHAWVEALLPDPDHSGRFLARPFDPTHGCEPGLSYVTVAVGRDYADVAPTSGTFRAPYPGRLSALKRAGAAFVETTDDDNRFAASSTGRIPRRGRA
jgi:transglutaminase-like putative cysteine protease